MRVIKPELVVSSVISAFAEDYKDKLIFSVAEELDDIILACKQASSNRLAIAGWTFFEIFKAGVEQDKSEYDVQRVAMAWSPDTGLPVGCAVVFDAWGDINAGCFVRSCHRRLGIGTRLIRTLLATETRPIRIHDGVIGSKNFWKVVGAHSDDYIRGK